jgi:ATP-binding cassette subfamily C (CFTR/MRP) protein 1
LSIGQRQLICIARALVKRPKILLMDEATANIDQKTDSVIQNLIKNTLKETTVVTIAHRLITIIQYDKIIILEQGKKVEEGSPAELLDLQGGWFRRLVNESGHGLTGKSQEEYINKMKKAALDHSLDPANLFA